MYSSLLEAKVVILGSQGKPNNCHQTYNQEHTTLLFSFLYFTLSIGLHGTPYETIPEEEADDEGESTRTLIYIMEHIYTEQPTWRQGEPLNNIGRPGTRPKRRNVTKCSLQNKTRDWELEELGGWVVGWLDSETTDWRREEKKNESRVTKGDLVRLEELA